MTIRVVTYNVHRCLGTDGRYSTARIADVLAGIDADIIALQELDLKRGRSGSVDQAHDIARRLKMTHQFHPALKVLDESYGDAVLSRYPMRLIKAAAIPGFYRMEPRGAVWVEVSTDEGRLQILNTHMGLLNLERRRQINCLMGLEWLGSQRCAGAVVFLGDLNARPGSFTLRQLSKRLSDVRRKIHKRLQPTYPSTRPFLRLDHIFVSADVHVAGAFVVADATARLASDHLPLCADISLVAG
ncbi:MAG: endonuclease [Hyphomicrobiales bacterium]|nr:endonuclease [Hyphomicrobiales bacterium]